jgi:hypothetical protein
MDSRADLGQTFRVREDESPERPGRDTPAGLLTRGRRRWAWAAFVALLLYAPVEAYLVNGPFVVYAMPPDSWLLSATVAALVGLVLIVDDVERRRASPPTTPEPSDE